MTTSTTNAKVIMPVMDLAPNRRPTPAIITITPNPAVDVTITVDKLIDEATHRIDTAARRIGGKGVNVATVAAAQGYPTATLGPVSGNSLALIEQRRDLNLPDLLTLDFSETPVPLRETWAIHQKDSNATVIINESGGQHPESLWNDIAAETTRLVKQGARVTTISGSWPKGTDEKTLDKLITAARSGGSQTVIVDTSGKNLVAACRAGAVIKPNAAEITATTGIDDPVRGARQLLGEGARLVIVSLGPDGLVAVSPDAELTAKLPVPVKGNPTGAGDALVAALATSFIDMLGLEETLKRAVAWSAAAVLVPYAGAIDDSWKNMLDQVIIGSN